MRYEIRKISVFVRLNMFADYPTSKNEGIVWVDMDIGAAIRVGKVEKKNTHKLIVLAFSLFPYWHSSAHFLFILVTFFFFFVRVVRAVDVYGGYFQRRALLSRRIKLFLHVLPTRSAGSRTQTQEAPATLTALLGYASGVIR